MSAVPAAVHEFLAAGVAMIPIPLGEKGPRTKGWQLRERAVFGEENAHRFAGMNAGLAHEWSRTCAIDIDAFDDADAWLTSWGVNLEQLFCVDDAVSVSSGLSNHGKLLFRLPEGASPPATFKVKADDGHVVLEFRCARSQDIVAGKHPQGTDYTVSGDPASMATLPNELWQIWQGLLHQPNKRPAEKRINGAARFATGGRNEALTREAGKLRRLGLSADAISAALQQVNLERCEPPLEQEEVETIGRSVGSYPPADDETKTLLPLIWARDAGPLLDTPYVIKKVIGLGWLIVIYGVPKSGKTFFATDMSLHVAAALPWFDHRVKRGLVIYIASEMGRGAERRVRAWLDHHLGGAADFDLPFAIVPRVVNLLDDLHVERLVATLESLIVAHGKPVLIVVDTLARSMAGGDENSAQDMGRAIAVADRLRDQFDTATVLVHHAGKDVTKGGRGSSALLGAADAYILVDSDQAGGHVATVEWSRDGEAGMRYGFRLLPVELGTDSDGDVATPCVLVPSAEAAAKPIKLVRRDVALEALREVIIEYGEIMPDTSTIPKGVKAVTLDQWRSRSALRTGYEDSSGNSIPVNFHKDKDALLKAGKVSISKPYAWTSE